MNTLAALRLDSQLDQLEGRSETLEEYFAAELEAVEECSAQLADVERELSANPEDPGLCRRRDEIVHRTEVLNTRLEALVGRALLLVSDAALAGAEALTQAV